jgi:hypothetical protein
MTQDDQASSRAVQSALQHPEDGMLGGFYLEKVEECMRLADAATDPRAREQWLRLAEGWQRLAAASSMQ